MKWPFISRNVMARDKALYAGHAVAAVAVAALADIPRVLRESHVDCHLTAIRADELEFSLKFWIADPINGTTNVRSLVMLAVWDAMKARDIEMAMAAPQ